MRSSAGLRSRNTSTTSPRCEPLVRRLHELLETEEGDDPLNWDGLARSADRIGRRGATPAARGAARTLLALLEGDARIVEALAAGAGAARPRSGSTRRWSPGGRTLAVLGVLGAAALVGGIQLAKSLTTPRLAVSGPAAGAQLGSATAGSVSFSSPGGRRELQAQRWRLDGRDVTRCGRGPVGPARLLPAPPLAGTPRGRRDRRRRFSRRDRASALQLRRRPDAALPRGRADHLSGAPGSPSRSAARPTRPHASRSPADRPRTTTAALRRCYAHRCRPASRWSPPTRPATRRPPSSPSG